MAQWRKIIVSGSNAELSHLSMSGDIDLTGNITGSSTSTGSFGYLAVSGDTTIGGNLTFGDASTDFVSFAADITSDIIPNASDSYDLGSTGQRWNNLWMSGSLTANGGPHSILSATTIDVDAEGALTLDGSSITIGGDSDVAVDMDASTFDVDASGALTLTSTTMAFDPSSTFDLDAAGAITIDGASITLGGDSDTAFDIDTSTLDIDASGAVTIDTSAGGVSVDAAAASNFTTAAGALTLNGAGGVNIAGNAAEIDITTSAAVDINSGAFTLNGSTVGIDGTGVLTMGAASMNIDADGGAIDIDATTTITVGGTNATAVSIGKSNTTVSIPGSLDVNGTLTTIDTTNLRVADRFIQMASGSTTGDGGIIVTTAANGSGSALFWDDSATRWGLTGDGETGDTQIAATPRQFTVSVSGSAVSPVGSNPSDFGASAATRIGMMHVNTATGDIFIFS